MIKQGASSHKMDVLSAEIKFPNSGGTAGKCSSLVRDGLFIFINKSQKGFFNMADKTNELKLAFAEALANEGSS